jgi:hypothetical protein
MVAAKVYEPSPAEYFVVGIVGSICFLLVGMVAVYSFYRGNRNEMTYYFFVCMILTCILEEPRFIVMAATKSYSSRTTYVCHLLASAAFFAGFSCVCYQWKGLLHLGTYSRLVYSAKGIVVVNTIFGCIDIIAVMGCSFSTSLQSYFLSPIFTAFTLLDALKNVIFAAYLSYYGLRLIFRFRRFHMVEKKTTNSTARTVFSIALHRLTVALVISTLCFMLRVTMLAMKIIALQYNGSVTSPGVPLFGLLWFFAADFIPRGLPSLAFISLMMYSRRVDNNEMNRGLLKSRPFSTDDPYENSGGVSTGNLSFLDDEEKGLNDSPIMSRVEEDELGYLAIDLYYDDLSYDEVPGRIAVVKTAHAANIAPLETSRGNISV